MSEKSGPKSRKKGDRIPGRNGGTLIVAAGRGPKKGAPNAGRPRDEWKARLQAMASRDEVLDHVERTLLAGPSDPFFQRALDYVTDHGYGRAQQSVDVTSKGESLVDILTAIARAGR